MWGGAEMNLSMFIDFSDVVLFASVALVFIFLSSALLFVRAVPGRYLLMSIFAASVWPALMLVQSVQSVPLFEQMLNTLNLLTLFAWGLFLSTAFMVIIPVYILGSYSVLAIRRARRSYALSHGE